MALIIVRVVIWLTFFLLIVHATMTIILARKAANHYFRKHKELEMRVEALERKTPQGD